MAKHFERELGSGPVCGQRKGVWISVTTEEAFVDCSRCERIAFGKARAARRAAEQIAEAERQAAAAARIKAWNEAAAARAAAGGTV